MAFFATLLPMMRCLMQNNMFGHTNIGVRVYDEVTAAAFEPYMARIDAGVVFREYNLAGELSSSEDFVCQ